MRGYWVFVAASAIALATAASADKVSLAPRPVAFADASFLAGGWFPSVYFQKDGFMPGTAVDFLTVNAEQEPAPRAKLGLGEVLYGEAWTDDGSIRMTLTRRRPDAAGFGALRVDMNGDGELRHSEAVPAKADGVYGPLSLELGDRRVECLLVLETTASMTDYVFGVLTPLEVPEGQVEVNGAKRRVVLLDCDFDGDFRGTREMPADYPIAMPESMVYIDLNGDGAPETGLADGASPEVVAAGSSLRLPGGEWVRLDVDEDGTEVDLVGPLETGSIAFEGKALTVELSTSDGGSVQAGGKTSPLEVPVGSYRIGSVMTTFDEDGAEWALTCGRDYPAPGGKLAVRSGETTTLDIPRGVTVAVTTSVEGEDYRVSLAVSSPSGLRVTGIMRDGEQPKAPSFTLTDESGKVVASGDFEYG